jgi:tRNA (guanine-N7-)-methyltransferase
LTHPKFLRLYQKILKPGGIIHLKTDSPALYNFTLQVIRLHELELLSDLDDVYAQPELNPVLQIKTHYEGLDIAETNRVHYLQFRLPTELLPDKDLELKELIRETETDRGN